MELISKSETFILGTFANGLDGGADASNRGGNPGFVQAVDDSTIVFPDYKVSLLVCFSTHPSNFGPVYIPWTNTKWYE